MQLITNQMINLFNQYYHDWQKPHNQDRMNHEIMYGIHYDLDTIEYMFNHRNQLKSLTNSIITVNSLPHVHYRRQFECIPNIFDELKQISNQLINDFDTPTIKSKLCAFLQLFDDGNKSHINTLIDREIRKGQQAANDIETIGFPYYSNDIQTKINTYMNHQHIHWKPRAQLDCSMNFFYEIIHEQIQPIIDEYYDITNNQKIIDNPEETSWIKNIKMDTNCFNGLPKYTRKFIQSNWQEYNDKFQKVNASYQVNRIMYTLALDKDIINMFNQVTNYLKQ